MRGAQEDVEVIFHQRPSENPPTPSFTHRGKHLGPFLAIAVIGQKAAPLQTATCYMVDAVLYFYSQWSAHEIKLLRDEKTRIVAIM
jgi:hypothetical protein